MPCHTASRKAGALTGAGLYSKDYGPIKIKDHRVSVFWAKDVIIDALGAAGGIHD